MNVELVKKELTEEQKITLQRLRARLDSDRLFHQHQNISEQFFGFNLTQQSRQNLFKILSALELGQEGILSHAVDQENSAFIQALGISQQLTEAEQHLFNILVNSFNLKHATNAIDPILTSGKLQAVRELEASGNGSARHTSKQMGADRSLYFTLGIGNHQSPDFLNSASHVITVDLNALQQHDPLAIERFWVGGHLTEYQRETYYSTQLDNVKFTMQHYKDNTKLYRFIFNTGDVLEWKQDYQDEVLSAKDVAPGIALRFIYMLRLLGGETNRVVSKLYRASSDPVACQPLLEKVFATLMPGWVYPEAKIVGELTISSEHTSIKEHGTTYSLTAPLESQSLISAIKRQDIVTFVTLLAKKYRPLNYSANLYEHVFDHIANDELRLQFIQYLIQYGFNPSSRLRTHQDAAIHMAAKKGSAADLDYILSNPCADKDEPLIGHIANPNMLCLDMQSEYIDVVDIACAFSGWDMGKLQVLKKHGANFARHGYQYLRTALLPGNSSPFDNHHVYDNKAAIQFLHQEGVSANSDNAWNKTPLMLACEQDYFAAVKFLVEWMHADINAPLKTARSSFLLGGTFYDDPSNGMTALHYAAKSGNSEIIRYLVKAGADLYAKTQGGQTPFDLYTGMEKDKLLKILTPKMLLIDGPNDKEESNVDVVSDKPQQELTIKNKPYQKVAVMVTGINDKGLRYVVLGKRHHDEENKPNYYCFPGGTMDVDDHSIRDAAQRELFEETGIDLNKIPQAQLNELIQVDGFNAYDHETTTFFIADVGNYPIKLHACDDLIEVFSVELNRLMFDATKAHAYALQYKAMRILGSNALLINYHLMRNKAELTVEETETIKQQLHIEADGYSMLIRLIKDNQKQLLPDSASWQELTHLLANDAHFAKKHWHSLCIEMLQANPLDGMSLLVKYGVDLNDYGQRGEFKIEGEEYYGTPLYYAIVTNQLNVLNHLLALGATFSDGYYDRQNALELAARRGLSGMVDFLLDQGIDPNRSYDYDGSPGSFIIFPIIGMAIKGGHNQLAQTLINDGRIFINRERSPSSRSTALMSAIEHDNKEAALMLLASGLVDVTFETKSSNASRYQNEPLKTALYYANKKGWEDIAHIITWFTRYLDMNDFLQKNNLPIMDSFLYTEDEKNNPTIHFYSREIEKLNGLLRYLHSSAEIRESADGYYIRMGTARLRSLLGNQHVAEFFIKNTAHSIIWSVRDSTYQQLHRELIENKIKAVSVESLEPNHQVGQFSRLDNKAYYKRLMRECASLKELVLDLGAYQNSTLNWLIDSISGHDRIKTVRLKHFCEMDFDASATKSWNQALQCLSSFPGLEKSFCDYLPFTALLELFNHLAINCPEKNIEITIKGTYKQEEYQELITLLEQLNWHYNVSVFSASADTQAQIEDVILTNQIKFYREQSPQFALRVNALQQGKLKTLECSLKAPIKGYPLANLVLTKVALQHNEPQQLELTAKFCKHHLNLVCDYIRNSRTLTTIKLWGVKKEPMMKEILKAIHSSNSPIASLIIPMSKLYTKEIQLLIDILARFPIKQLDLEYTTFTTPDEKLIANLNRAFTNSQDLEFLNINYCRVNGEYFRKQFHLNLTKSSSLLVLEVCTSFFKQEDGLNRAIDMMLERNRDKQQALPPCTFFGSSTAPRGTRLIEHSVSMSM
jgi:ankyrin repeat protein/ADP-ribose pyrophosphatase YjhB (NUDIX family)